MRRRLIKKYSLSGKAFMLLGFYVLHFVLVQSVVIGFYDSHRIAMKSFFSGPEKKTNPNSGIATFRTLEKHDASQRALKFPEIFSASSRRFNMFLLVDGPVCQVLSPGSFHRPDTSYRLYARDRVFLI